MIWCQRCKTALFRYDESCNSEARSRLEKKTHRHARFDSGKWCTGSDKLQTRGQIQNQASALIRRQIDSGLIFVTRSGMSGDGARREDRRWDNESVRKGAIANELWPEQTHINRLIMTNERRWYWAARGHLIVLAWLCAAEWRQQS